MINKKIDEVYFICDESGAKGYSDNKESFEGEVGVLAGILINGEMIETVRRELEIIRDKFSTDGKLHITDLDPESQQDLRSQIFDYIKENNIKCVYSAIHVQGFFNHRKELDKIIGKGKQDEQSRVKVSTRYKKELLHAKLFQGAFGKAAAYCLDHVGKRVKVNVITDRTDDSIIRLFKDRASKLLRIGDAPSLEVVTGFDTVDKKVVKGSIKQEIKDPHGLLGDFSGISFEIEIEDSELTLVADVLANSLNHYFINREGEEIGSTLHRSGSIKGFELEHCFYGMWDDDDIEFAPDAFYKHPKSK